MLNTVLIVRQIVRIPVFPVVPVLQGDGHGQLAEECAGSAVVPKIGHHAHRAVTEGHADGRRGFLLLSIAFAQHADALEIGESIFHGILKGASGESMTRAAHHMVFHIGIDLRRPLRVGDRYDVILVAVHQQVGLCVVADLRIHIVIPHVSDISAA